MRNLNGFIELFQFDPSKVLYVGMERERFLTDKDYNPVPHAAKVLEILPNDRRFGYELSACQLEDRTYPVPIHSLYEALRANDHEITRVLQTLGLSQLFTEVAPLNMDLTVYKDPDGRYEQIVKFMPHEVLEAACRVAGTHVHIGMPDFKTALQVYNEVIPYWTYLSEMINHSRGERFRLYKIMAPNFEPRPYKSVEDFYQDAVAKNFADDPRKNWQLIRITRHGTIEFRMGGSTRSYDEVVGFAEECHRLCYKAIHGQPISRVF
jgi:Glutamate-cysteine ligase family 2(GCS2)